MLPREHSSDILVKKVAAFCSCLKSLPEATVKSFILIPQTEEISEQPGIDFIVWFLAVTLMKIIMKRSRISMANSKIKILKRKGAPGSGTELNPVFKKIDRRNGIKGVVTQGKILPTQVFN